MTEAGARPSQVRLASLLLILAAYACFACLDTTAKYLGLTLAPMQIVFMRFATQAVLATAALQPWRRPAMLRVRRPALQAVRALALLGATLFNFVALRYLQLAETTAVFFVAPLMVAALAGPFLGEWAGARRWAAICVGFGGALVVVRPGLAGFHPAMLLSLASTASYSVYVLLTRKLAAESTESLLLVPALLGTLLMVPAGIAFWEPVPGIAEWALLGMTGVFAGVGHWLLILAYEKTPTPVLAPLQYTQIVWMVTLGYLVFGDVPDAATGIGVSIIVASGLYLLYRERAVAGRASGPAG